MFVAKTPCALAHFGSLSMSPVLSGGFSESSSIRLSIDAPFPEDKAPFTDEYDYDSDSDLDEEEVADCDIDIIKMPLRGSSSPLRYHLC